MIHHPAPRRTHHKENHMSSTRTSQSPTNGPTEETPAMSGALTDAEWREMAADRG